MKKLRRQKSYYNFESARTIGVLFDATKQESYLIAKGFMASLTQKNIQVTALGYVRNKEAIGYFPFHQGIDFFSIKKRNWYLKPVNSNIDSFQREQFDMLIDLTFDDYLQLKYIVGLAKAKFKLGTQKDYTDLYDLVIEMKNSNLKSYIDQIKHYLSVMKKA